MKIWTCGSSPRIGPQNAWTRIKNVNDASSLSNFWNFFRRNPNDFLSRLVTMEETWLYHYESETKQQSVEWRHISSPRPRKFRVQKSAGKVLASIFWDQEGILLTDYLPKGQLSTRSITHLCWCNWRTFWRKNAAGRSTRESCSCTIMPRLTGHLQPRRNWHMWASNVLITHPILRIWPHWTTTCSLDWKNNWKVAIFLLKRRSLLPWRPGWTDNLLNFFLSGLQKLEQRAKKCIDSWGVCWINPEFGHCSLLPSFIISTPSYSCLVNRMQAKITASRWVVIESVAKFKYLGMTPTNPCWIHEEIKSRLNSGNAWYYSVQNLLFSSLLFKNIKLKIHKTIILSIVVYGCNTCTLTN